MCALQAKFSGTVESMPALKALASTGFQPCPLLTPRFSPPWDGSLIIGSATPHTPSAHSRSGCQKGQTPCILRVVQQHVLTSVGRHLGPFAGQQGDGVSGSLTHPLPGTWTVCSPLLLPARPGHLHGTAGGEESWP